jgi:hypothetical protein
MACRMASVVSSAVASAENLSTDSNPEPVALTNRSRLSIRLASSGRFSQT